MRWSRRLFRILLLAYPKRIRQERGADMWLTFERHLRDARRAGRLAVLDLWRREVIAPWRGGRRTRISVRERRPAHRRPVGSERTKSFLAFGMSWLDFKLGFRMLVKHPGLTCVSVFALAIGIPAGLAPTHVVNAVIEAPLPVDEGDRIRVLRYWNVATVRVAGTTSYDFMRWGEALTTFEVLGAWRSSAYNINSEDGFAAPVLGAEVTASTFDILRVRPLLGRTLVSADEVIGAPTVVIIGYDLWQSRLGSDPDVVGRTIQIGRVSHTVVGVMPEEFLFPTRHQLWLPLRERLADDPRRGLALTIFGRLSDGISPEEAQTELSTLGRRLAIEFPNTHERLHPEVVPFAYMFFGLPKGGFKAMPAFYLVRIFALLLLVVACSNVGMLIFARAATRSAEFAVRTALGGSRTRIISQVFTESLVLAVSAAGVGLLLIDWLPSLLPSVIAEAMPYWIDLGVTSGTVFWALSLAVFSAAVAGVVPALKVTGKAVQRNIQRAAASRSGIRFSGMSSALIVADVAIAVAVVGFAAGISDYLRQARDAEDAVGIQADQFLSVQLTFPGTEAASGAGASDRSEFMARVAATQQALVRRLEAEPGIRGVAVGSALPRMQHPSRQIELDGESLSDNSRAPWVKTARVDVDFFRALEQPILMGRGFDTNDLGEDRSAVIVNKTFVDRLLGGRNPIGRRLRYKTSGGGEPGPWYEIVGVVGPLGMILPRPGSGFYHPATPGEIHPLRLAIHVGDDPESFTPRLRALAGEVDPIAVIAAPVPLNEVVTDDWYDAVAMALGGGILVVILLMLAASGIYAIMSFSVAERTREIGIRTALGAQRSSIAFTVVRRALAQLGVGVLLGMPIARWLFLELQPGSTYPASVVALILGVSVVVLVGLLACTAPTLRALRIMPTEALREGG